MDDWVLSRNRHGLDVRRKGCFFIEIFNAQIEPGLDDSSNDKVGIEFRKALVDEIGELFVVFVLNHDGDNVFFDALGTSQVTQKAQAAHGAFVAMKVAGKLIVSWSDKTIGSDAKR